MLSTLTIICSYKLPWPFLSRLYLFSRFLHLIIFQIHLNPDIWNIFHKILMHDVGANISHFSYSTSNEHLFVPICSYNKAMKTSNSVPIVEELWKWYISKFMCSTNCSMSKLNKPTPPRLSIIFLRPFLTVGVKPKMFKVLYSRSFKNHLYHLHNCLWYQYHA